MFQIFFNYYIICVNIVIDSLQWATGVVCFVCLYFCCFVLCGVGLFCFFVFVVLGFFQQNYFQNQYKS